jgi:alpha-1,3-glucan synthase
MSYELVPHGSNLRSSLYFALLAILPFAFGFLAVYLFQTLFYRVVFNTLGRIQGDKNYRDKRNAASLALRGTYQASPSILIATLEYEIPDWSIKVRIGGLGVISSLMGTYLKNDIVWVVPMVGDVDYPPCEELESISIFIYGKHYSIKAYVHLYNRVKYILLDSGIFRTRTRKDPYTAKMNDLESAVFYSAWNQCIAEVIRRENVDIYHINDFHGAIAPLYLLPQIIPCALSLHNAEFQGLWPLRTQVEVENVCSVFNLPIEICRKYVQYGNTFNLLHGAAMYLHYHQKGYGAGGVSDRYGERCFARYPTLWSLSGMTSIQNPNPSDLETEDKALDGVVVEDADEDKKISNKLKTQEWAGIEQNAEKTLFIFVGRWSRQKGLDLIADLAPKLMETYPSAQLLAIGPVIDLHGRFAALKLEKVMEAYPDRVFVKPEFTKIPSFVFQGADFVLLPSRDEPFG